MAAGDPDGLADRQEQLELLTGSMLRGSNVVLLAPRRYGKTSLLLRAVADVRAGGGRSGWVSLAGCATPRDVAETLLRGVLEGPADWLTRQEESVRSRLASLAAEISFTAAGTGLRVRLGLDPAGRSWSDATRSVLGILAGLAAESRRPVSLAVDEFQEAYQIDRSLPGVFKTLIDELPAVGLVLCGSRRALMEQLTSGRRAPLARVGTKLVLPKVPRGAMVDFLMRRAAAAGKLVAEDVAGLIHDRAAGVPNEVQQLAALAFDLAPRRIGAAHVERATELLVAHARGEYRALWAHAAPAQRKLLRVLADEGSVRSLATRAMVQRVQVANPSSVMAAARALEEADLVETGDDGWVISNPFLARWIRDHIDVE